PGRGRLALALLLAPRRGAASRWALHWRLHPGPGAGSGLDEEPPASAAARALADNAMAPALPMFEALARGQPARLRLALSARSQLGVVLEPLGAQAGAGA
ncbi:MAG: hypothetical protein KGL50_06530, partial [Burkholderiales bacterium]|nr:hypothetical protein [Burkholderiales bacterium]